MKERLKKYADLIVRTGVNVKKNQTVMIGADIEAAEFARMVAKSAYENGAKNVIVEYSDAQLSLIKFNEAPDEAFLEFPKFKAEYVEELYKNGACTIGLTGGNPDLLKDVDPKRMANANKTRSIAMKKPMEYTMSSKVEWCVAGVATPSWAKKVFPDLSEEQGVEKLWDAILKACRVDAEDVNQAWKEHDNNLQSKADYLNKMQFAKLNLKSAITDLEVKLPENHIWEGGGGKSGNGTYFLANIPTEEVFTAPAKYGINGVVGSTKPLVYNGSLIDKFTLTVKDGQVVDFDAEVGKAVLETLLKTDKGSSYFGEIALVPNSSPISQSEIVYYNTLFDENASCHLALGAAYVTCVEGAMGKSDEELEEMGVNTSLNHEDFMIGSQDMNIIGTTKDGEKIQIFKAGEWAI
ncbi:MAG: aminopeptidase [Filifactoraceae bacterium]